MIDTRVSALFLLLSGACAPAATVTKPVTAAPRPASFDIETVPAAPDAVEPSPEVVAAPATTESDTPCDLMRTEGREADDSKGVSVARLPDQALERTVRRYYEREVWGGGIDQRRLDQHPIVFDRGVTAPAALVSACVDYWRYEDPTGLVPGVPHFEAGHEYVEVRFEFNDASDGENAYTAFVDAKTLDVVAGFFYSNFQP